MLPAVTLRPLIHRQQEVIGIDFYFNKELEISLRKLAGIKWSQTHKLWYMPLSKDSYQQIKLATGILVKLDDQALRNYLQKRKQVVAINSVLPTNAPSVTNSFVATQKKPPVLTPAWQLIPEN